jgi:hypothetical protein
MEGDEKDDKTGEKIDDKESDEEGNNRHRKKDDKDDKCHDNGHYIYNCNTLSFDECVECDKQLQAEGILLNAYCGKSDNATSKECFNIPNNITNGISIMSYFDYKNEFCSSNQNATFDSCQSVNYGDVYCYNNPKVTKGTTEYENCKDHYSKSPGQCASNNILTYKDCEKYNHQLDYCARNPNVIRNSDGMEECCLSGAVYETNYLKKYIDNYEPIPFTKPKIEELSLKNPDDINTHACTLRENCKNIEVTPDNVYPARPLCSNITIGYNENDSREYDFSDTICSNIKKLVEEDTFNNEKVGNPGYQNLIQEYCHCLDPKPEETEEQEEPEICKLFNYVKPKVTN